jgi:hypothetical protein
MLNLLFRAVSQRHFELFKAQRRGNGYFSSTSANPHSQTSILSGCDGTLEVTMRGRERKDAFNSRLPIDDEYGETERSFRASTGASLENLGC